MHIENEGGFIALSGGVMDLNEVWLFSGIFAVIRVFSQLDDIDVVGVINSGECVFLGHFRDEMAEMIEGEEVCARGHSSADGN